MIVIYFIAHSEWILHRSRADMVKLLKSNFQIVSVSPLNEYVDEIKEDYFESINWGIDRTKLLDIKGIVNLKNIIKNFNENDIIHIFTIKSLYLFIFATMFFKKNFKVIVSITGLGFLFADTLLAKMLRNISKPIIRLKINTSVDILIFQNKNNLDQFVKYSNYKNNSIMISGSGLNINKFVTKKEPNDVTKIIFVGRLMREKGINEFLKIAEEFVDDDRVLFFVAGKPDFGNKSSLNAIQFEQLQKNPAVNYLGEIDVQKELSKYDLLLQPSYHEGFSRILIESIYSGVFCIANNIFGMKEIIEKTKYGVLIDGNNINDYKNEIIKFIDSQELPNYEFAKKTIIENYSLEAIAKQFEELYDELIK